MTTKPKTHPLQIAEQKLRVLGIKHAPIQGFIEGDDVDGRYVGAWNDPGTYYLLGGIDNADKATPDTRGKIQLLYLNVPEDAHEIAVTLGWTVTKIEQLPCPDGAVVMAATLVPNA